MYILTKFAYEYINNKSNTVIDCRFIQTYDGALNSFLPDSFTKTFPKEKGRFLEEVLGQKLFAETFSSLTCIIILWRK